MLSGRERELLEHPQLLRRLLDECQKRRTQTIITTQSAPLAKQCRARGIQTLRRLQELQALVPRDHPQYDEVLRAISPHLWRQQLVSQLQSMGLLSLPRLRTYSLVTLSLGLFLFIVLRLLPSATVHVRPHQDAVSHTTNLFLTTSGAVLPEDASAIPRLPLIPITVRVQRTVTHDQISREFRGTPARLQMRIVNTSTQNLTLVSGTRFLNQAGMIFRLDQRVSVPAKSQKTTAATAGDTDTYGEIIGERGNVPADLEWTLPGLSPELQPLVKGINTTAGTGGTTAFAHVVSEQDLTLARARLEQELLTAAEQLREGERTVRNANEPNASLRLLTPTRLVRNAFQDVSIPFDQIGTEADSIDVTGSLEQRVLAYDAQTIFQLLRERLSTHVREGKLLRTDLLDLSHLDVRVIYYDDNLAWAKITVELTGTEEYNLNPLTPDGALFAKRVREGVVGRTLEEAERVVQNMPEVASASVSLWPPWQGSLPSIPAHISLETPTP